MALDARGWEPEALLLVVANANRVAEGSRLPAVLSARALQQVFSLKGQQGSIHLDLSDGVIHRANFVIASSSQESQHW